MISPLPELIECVATGRDPTVAELFHVAGRIWIDSAPDRSAFAWEQLQPASDDRTTAIRLALVATRGGD
ncbi:MAG: hypothetical protein EOO77_26025 [Oxalobacteraceae bacterium]|nr:MAG: hypothetical protein EOO77_26025 [Oxalobacteraceae bacterium]